MAEIFRDSVDKGLTFDIVPSAFNISARAFVNSDTVGTDLSMVIDDDGVWAAMIPYSITYRDCSFYILWTYNVEGTVYTKKEYHKVVTPLIRPADILNFDHDLEFLVRSIIEAHTGNSFGLERKKIIVQAQDEDSLRLPMVLNELISINNQYNSYNISAFRVSGSGLTLRMIPGSDLDPVSLPDDAFSAQGEIIYAPGTPYRFKSGLEFVVEGDWGYSEVPDRVKQAARLLYSDYSCSDAAYRNKYINEFKGNNGGFKMLPEAFNGTGNLTADLLLESYSMPRMVIF